MSTNEQLELEIQLLQFALREVLSGVKSQVADAWDEGHGDKEAWATREFFTAVNPYRQPVPSRVVVKERGIS
jgi:hypothetical protein